MVVVRRGRRCRVDAIPLRRFPWALVRNWRHAGGLLAWLALAGSLTQGACTNPRAQHPDLRAEPAVIQASGKFRKEYLLVPGDQIEVSVWRVPEISRTVVVRSDGAISLPLIDDVQAAGLTTRELKAKLTELLAHRLVNPDVSVIAVQSRPATVYVLGDVKNPTAVPLRGATTAIQAIGLAGGFVRSSAASDVSIIRLLSEGRLVAIPVDVKDKSQPGPYMALSLVLLQPDDIVFVPENGRSEVTRFLEDFIGKPLLYANFLADTYLNYRVVKDGL
jgi:protein involved in polysaccharide export with SLBB domain